MTYTENDFYSDFNLSLFEDAAEHAEAVARDAIEPGTALDVPTEYLGLGILDVIESITEAEREAYYAYLDAEGMHYSY